MTSTPTGRVLSRLIDAGEEWEQYDAEAIASECMAVLGVDPGEVAALDLLQIAAKHKIDLRASAPCPSWCREGHGHAYRSVGDEWRTHRGLIGQSDELGIEVSLESLEKKVSGAGTVAVEAPYVWVSLDQDVERSPESLRQLAALLLDAADSADKLLGVRGWTEDEL